MDQTKIRNTQTSELLAFALVAAALSACGGSAPESDDASQGAFGTTSQALRAPEFGAEISLAEQTPALAEAPSSSEPSAEGSAPRVGPLKCVFQTVDGHYLTAVGAGGRTTDVLHTDATRVGSWEEFTLVDSGDGNSFIHYGIVTANGHYLTAVGGGGRISDVIHSDATELQDWEKFTLWSLGYGVYAIETIDGHYLTAVDGGGRITDTIHSDATVIDSWEKFTPTCTQP